MSLLFVRLRDEMKSFFEEGIKDKVERLKTKLYL